VPSTGGRFAPYSRARLPGGVPWKVRLFGLTTIGLHINFTSVQQDFLNRRSSAGHAFIRRIIGNRADCLQAIALFSTGEVARNCITLFMNSRRRLQDAGYSR
jgi:hypothetical protein